MSGVPQGTREEHQGQVGPLGYSMDNRGRIGIHMMRKERKGEVAMTVCVITSRLADKNDRLNIEN